MTVYPDLLFLQGFFLCFGAYVLALFLLELHRSFWILLFCTAVSAMSSVLAILPAVPFLLSVLLGIGVILVLFHGKNVKGTLSNSFVGILVSVCVFSGYFFFSGMVFSVSVAETSSGAYFLLSFSSSIGAVVLSVGVFCFILRVRAKRRQRASLYDCVLVLEGKTLSFYCYGDSGNLLTDPATGFPVVILEFSVLRRSFGRSFPPPLTYEFLSRFGTRARVVTYRSVSGEGQILSAFLPEEFRVEGVVKDAVIAVTEGVLEQNGRFSAILGPQLMEGVSYELEKND